MATPISFSFRELGVDDALGILSEASRIGCRFNLTEWKKRGINRDSPVTFKAVHEPLADLIDKVLTGLALDWYVPEPGLILVVPQAQGVAALEPRAYGIQDLCDRGHTVEGVTSLIKNLEPGSWTATGGLGSVRSLAPGLLIVSQTRSIHRQIEKLLDKLAPIASGSTK